MSDGDIEERNERGKVYFQSTPHSKSNPVDFPSSSYTFEHTLPAEYIQAIHVPLPPSDNSISSNEEEVMELQEQRTFKELAAPTLDQQPVCMCTRHSIPHLNSSPASFICCQHSMDSPEKIQTNIWRSFMLFAQVWNPLESQRNESSYQPSHSL